MDDCEWSEAGHLVGLPKDRGLEWHAELEAALARPANHKHKSWALGLPHYECLRRLVEYYVERNESYAIIYPDGRISIVRDQSPDLDFATKALPDEHNVQRVTLGDKLTPLPPTEFAFWASAFLFGSADDKYKHYTSFELEAVRNYAAEYLIRHGGWAPILGPVIFAHPYHGVPEEENVKLDMEEEYRKTMSRFLNYDLNLADWQEQLDDASTFEQKTEILLYAIERDALCSTSYDDEETREKAPKRRKGVHFASPLELPKHRQSAEAPPSTGRSLLKRPIGAGASPPNKGPCLLLKQRRV